MLLNSYLMKLLRCKPSAPIIEDAKCPVLKVIREHPKGINLKELLAISRKDSAAVKAWLTMYQNRGQIIEENGVYKIGTCSPPSPILVGTPIQIQEVEMTTAQKINVKEVLVLKHGKLTRKIEQVPLVDESTLKSFDTGVKHRIRSEMRSFLRTTVLKDYSPKDIHVLCLPSSQAVEIFDVYDKLGIPRKNIIGVERDEDRYNLLASKSLGITIIKSPLEKILAEKFLATTFGNLGGSKSFHIMNLDLQSNFNRNIVNMLYDISEQKLLADKAVFMITYLRGRETDLSRAYLRSEIMLQKVLEKLSEAKHASNWENIRHGGLVLTDLKDLHVDMSAWSNRDFVDWLIIDHFMGMYDLAHALEQCTKDYLSTPNFGPRIDPMVDLIAKSIGVAMEREASFLVKDCKRFMYQSGHSPMRVLLLQLQRLKTHNDFVTGFANVFGRWERTLPVCIPIQPPKA